MPQVVDSSNVMQFISTGKVDSFKPPEPDKVDNTTSGVDKEPVKGEPPRDAVTGKFTKQEESGKNTPASSDDDDDSNLSEVVRRKIDKKHRQAKEAEERERRETLRAIAAERRAEEAERKLSESEKSRPVSKAEAPKEPKQEDFATIGEYTDALVSYRVDQRLREESDKRERDATERAKAQRQQEFAQRVRAFNTKHSDYQDVLDSIAGTELEQVPQDVIEYVQESDLGPDLLYHLAKNPDVLGRLRALSPRRFIAELGKLEAKLEKPAEPENKTALLSEAAQPQVSKAPAPIAPLDTAGIAPVAKKPQDMSVQELRQYRKQQEAEARARR